MARHRNRGNYVSASAHCIVREAGGLEHETYARSVGGSDLRSVEAIKRRISLIGEPPRSSLAKWEGGD